MQPDFPQWSLYYFFRKIKPFLSWFIFAGMLSSISAYLSYKIADFIKEIIDNYESINALEVTLVLLFIVASKELIGYISRAKIEGIVIKFKDYIRIEAFNDVISKIKYFDNDPNDLQAALNEYLGTAFYMSGGFLAGLMGKITSLTISFVVLWSFGTIPFLANISIMLAFFVLSYFFSKRYVELSKPYSEKSIEFESKLSAHILSVDYQSRNNLVANFYERPKLDKWGLYDKVKLFHAKRWFWQLFPFGVVYVLTIGFLLHRVQLGLNSIGDISLVQWYYGVILSTSIFITESATDLAKQKASSVTAHGKILSIIREIPRESSRMITIQNGEMILVEGPNGSGKTTALYEFISRNNSVSYFSGENYPDDKRLSSGELQRQMVNSLSCTNNDCVFIYDEPCSNTSDTEWFENILQSLRKDNKTAIVVSHAKIGFNFDRIINF